jgi:hypothetical protein
MKKWYFAVAAILIGLILVFGVAVWLRYVDTLNALKHETKRWAVIEDRNGYRIAVEPVSDHVWATLAELSQNGTKKWVGGIVERYDNKWGFRFKPDTVTVAEATAEGLQGTIEYISTHMDYWLNSWAYVSAKVVEVHSET